jgi:hypothetical protein
VSDNWSGFERKWKEDDEDEVQSALMLVEGADTEELEDNASGIEGCG